MMMSLKCYNRCEIAFDQLRQSFNAVLKCKIAENIIMFVDQCALMHMTLGNVRLLEHGR